jgi:outer membrane protein assembly factor BamB
MRLNYNLITLAISFWFIFIFNETIGQNCNSILIGTDRTGGGNTLIEFDPSTGTSTDLFELSPTSNSAYGFVVSGQYCYIHREFSPTENFLYCVDIETGVYNPNFPVEVSDNALFQANSCGMILYGLQRENNGVVELVSFDLETGVGTIISPSPLLFDLPIPPADGSQIASSALTGNLYCFTAENDSGQNTASESDPVVTCIDITTGEFVDNFSLGRTSLFDEFVFDEASGLLYGLIRESSGLNAFFASLNPVDGTFTTINPTPLTASDGSNPTIVGSTYCYTAETQANPFQTETQFTCLDLATGNVVIDLPDVEFINLSAYDTNCSCEDMNITTAIPTASEWGLIILSLLLLCFSIVTIRNRELKTTV